LVMQADLLDFAITRVPDALYMDKNYLDARTVRIATFCLRPLSARKATENARGGDGPPREAVYGGCIPGT